MKYKSLIVLISLSILVADAGGAPTEDATAFINTHCISCHGTNKAKGDLRLDTIKWTPTDSQNVELWQEIADRIDANEMPPEEQPQPSDRERDAIITSLRGQIASAAQHSSKHVVLRRLNRAQFRNSLRDLLHIEVEVEDPTEAFPADDKEDGFDNLGEVLQMSDFLLRQYLKVARSAVDRATFDGEQPEPQTYNLGDTKSRALNYKAPGNDPERDYVVLYLNDERAPGDPRGQQFINCREGATHDGWYEFEFEVESKGRGTLANELRVQDRDDYQIYRAEDLHRFEVYLAASHANSQIQTRPRHLVVAIDLPDNKRQVIKRRFWLPKGWRVEAGFGNGFGSNGETLLRILDPDFDWEAFNQFDKRKQRGDIGKIIIDRLEQRDAPRIIVHSVTLRDEKVLEKHVDRMLADQRSDEFVQSFVWAWLKLQNTVEMAPDPMKFYEYHRNRLGEAMITETNHFFRHLLTENLPISNFIDSDFAIINTDLGRHYGISSAINTTARFQKVAITETRHRGGLLGQSSVLTASANGVDTSPVVRGIWILDNLLGTPPSPPPPDVEIPEPDARGDLTIRQLYAKHRTVSSCNDCHKKIDPLGFSLENFDAIGAWRTAYDSGHDIDASGRMPNGETFSDVAGLKRILTRDLDQFSRNLTTKLLTYATGRPMAVRDRPQIDAIVERLKAEREDCVTWSSSLFPVCHSSPSSDKADLRPTAPSQSAVSLFIDNDHSRVPRSLEHFQISRSPEPVLAKLAQDRSWPTDDPTSMMKMP